MPNYNFQDMRNSSEGAENVTMEEPILSCLDVNLPSVLFKVFPESESETDDLFAWLVEGVLILAAFLVGMVGNSFSIIIFSRQKVHRIFHHLLLLLAIFDMVSGNVIFI
jgi:hypothetical protein